MEEKEPYTYDPKDTIGIVAKIQKIKNPRFNYYLDWNSISIGISISRTHVILDWKWYVGIDLVFLSLWVYFLPVKK